jgi:NADH-quinone oxidoreductase subunit N
MLIGVALLFGLAGATSLPALSGLPVTESVADRVGLVIPLVLVVTALTFKIGAVPAHAWVPDVAQGAPAPAAAFVTTVPKVGGFIFLARLFAALPAEALDWRLLVALLATATMTLGNLAALWQDDIRRLLGWSSVSQTGYGLLAIVALGLSDLAVPSLLFFLLAYSLGNLAAFGVVVELRGRTRLEDYAGLARSQPWLAGALTLAFLSFIGVPPLAGFFAKLVLFGAAIEAGYAWLAVVAAVNTVVSIVYYVRVLAPAYFGDRAEPVPVLGRWARVATFVMTAAVILAGIAAEPFWRAFAEVGLVLE